MSLFLDLPDDLVLNYILLFIGDVQEILTLRLVSKSFNEKVEILLLAIVELDLTNLESLKSDNLFSAHKVVLEDLEDIKKMQNFRLKTLNFTKDLEDFDYFIGQGLMALSRNSLIDFGWEEVEEFLQQTLVSELREIYTFQISQEAYRKASQMCIHALSIPRVIDEKQRKVYNWLTGALKMCQIFFSLEPNYKYLVSLKLKHDFYSQRVSQISKYFGMSEQIN